MYRGAGSPIPHISTPDDISTINYTLEFPHLENPSNTTFAGAAQIDICRCPRLDLPPQHDAEPGHIYTRYKCVGPKVRFHSPEEDLWVLQAPRGPINMLRPARQEEKERRKEIHHNTEPTVYAGRNFLFLTGPCPRGRYQAYATLHFLKSLTPEARNHVTCLSLLIQPYEEDCSHDASQQAYANLADYIVHDLPGFQTLCLNIWDDEMGLQRAASEFCLLLHKEGVKIVVWCCWIGGLKEYSSVRTFLEAMTTTTRNRRFELGGSKDRVVWMGASERDEHEEDEAESEEQEHREDGDNKAGYDGKHGSLEVDCTDSSSSSRRTSILLTSPTALVISDDPRQRETEDDENLDCKEDSEESRSDQMAVLEETSDGQAEDPRKAQSSDRPERATLPTQPEHATASKEAQLSDDDWIDATLSPISPDRIEEGSWQVL